MAEELRRFVYEQFTRWDTLDLNSIERLVVDGDSICTQLYRKLDNAYWLLGGEYPRFCTAVREFFAEILFTGVQLLVIFSGIKVQHPGAESVYLRSTRFNDAVRKSQGRMGWTAVKHSKVLPLVATAAFMDVLRNLGIEIRVASGDARREVAAFANHFKCPVLASDWDFFVFELEAGYLPFDKLSTVIASGLVFRIVEFMAEFSINDPKLLLLFPALLGCDQLEKVTADCDFVTALGRLSSHATCEGYLFTAGDDDTRRNFEILKSYFCNPKLPPDYDLKGGGGGVSEVFTNLPEWVAHSFALGRFEPELLNVHLNNTYTLQTLVEDMSRDSAWLVSRPIRQHLYGIMGLPGSGSVQEIIRAKSSPEVIDAHVSPCNFDPSLNLGDFTDKGKKALEDIVLGVLNCSKLSHDDRVQEFDTLEDKWKLPIAATFYWYHGCDNPPVQRHLVKSLLVCFLTCSGEIQKLGKIPPFEPVTRDAKHDVLTALHAFAQWQCVYHDARALNYLAREPFSTTSPASLYSGEVAMHYASFARKNLRVDSAIAAGSEQWVLYNKFLYLVTGSDGRGKVGGHAKRQPKPKAPPLMVEEAPPLKQTNRYASLPDSP